MLMIDNVIILCLLLYMQRNVDIILNAICHIILSNTANHTTTIFLAVVFYS